MSEIRDPLIGGRVRAEEPADDVCGGGIGPGRSRRSPYLLDAARALVSRYPDVDSGLSRTDRSLLQAVREFAQLEKRTARIIAEVISVEHDELDWTGDRVLFARLRALGDRSLTEPLVQLEGDLRTLRSTEVVGLTSTGVAVLEGRENHVRLNGIDERIGGVHLDSRTGRVWFRSGDTLVAGGRADGSSASALA